KKDTENKEDLLSTINNGIKSAGVAVSSIVQSTEFVTLTLSIALDKVIDKYLPIKGILNAISIFGISAGLTEKIPLNAADEGKLAEKIPLDKELKYLEKLPGVSIRKDLVIDLPLNIKGNQDYLEKIKIRDEQTFVEEIPWDQVIEGNTGTTPEQLVQEIPDEYKQIFKCKDFADKMEELMRNNNVLGERLSIESETDFILSDKHGTISYNGIHDAIKINDTIYDNLNPDGIDYDEWLIDLGIADYPSMFNVVEKKIK
ncbi:papain fold toxin domain-containing protein, partial [Holdemania massiliensis]|uniref:papain fold toxin domain-containing protein n=1 Tax=Holdemania massiliensis TaxID=1468449 RepID=UPI00058AD7C1